MLCFITTRFNLNIFPHISIGLKKKDGTKKRKLGRNPRVPFTQHQVAVLEHKFRRTHYLSSLDVAELSTALSLTENRVSDSQKQYWHIRQKFIE